MTNDLGTLVIVVLKAKNLPDKHTFHKQDVFAQVSIHDATKKTSIDIKGGQHPVWDEEFRVPILGKSSDDTRTLNVSCWSQEPRGPEVIGKGKIDISETLRTGEFDDWILLDIEGVYKGELYLEMTFYAAGPPPSLSRRPSKLAPKDRLVRPAQPYVYHNGAGKHSSSQPSKSPRYKQDALPSLPEESDPTPSAVPALLRPGRPSSSFVRTPPSSPPQRLSPVHSPPSSPPQTYEAAPTLPRDSQPLYANAPLSLRPGRPQSQSEYPRGEQFAAPISDTYASYSSSNVYSPSSSPPQAYKPVPALPREPQPLTGLAYAPRFLRSGYPQSQSDYTRDNYNAPTATDTYDNGEGRSYFPRPEVPQAPPPRPYPYNYPPPPRDPDLDAPQFSLSTQQYNHRPSFPLLDEPEGVVTPTPAHPYGYVSPLKPPIPSNAPPPVVSYNRQEASNGKQHVSAPSEFPARKSQEEDRDQLLALAIEREEETRKKYLAEQEAHDLELARKLDMELNLEQDNDRAARETALS